jgi:hypothetical protein
MISVHLRPFAVHLPCPTSSRVVLSPTRRLVFHPAGVKRIGLFLAAVSCGWAQPAERPVNTPVPTHEVRRVTKSITVDGKLTEEDWKSAPSVTLQFPWEEQTGAKQKTTVRLLWNDEMIYVAFECADADIVAHHDQRDDPTYKDDAVELFIQPNPRNSVYVGLEMNARGTLYDYLYVFPQVLVKAYDLKGVQLATSIDGSLNLTSDRDKGWVLELGIPLHNFAELMGGKPVTAGSTWFVNLNRWDGTEPHRRLSVWSDSATVRPSPHNPKRFGQLTFVQ